MAGGIDWFRWHHGSVTDPKFQLVARKAGATLPEVLAVWAYLLEKASAAEFRGCFGEVDCESIDCLFGMADGTTESILFHMVDRKLIADEYVVAWEKRQPKREDETANERKRRQREREHALALSQTSVTDDASRDVTQGHAQVTPGHARGEESREEQIQQPPAPSGAAPPSPKSTKRSPVECPEGVSAQVWSDWLALRKAKKAPVTMTVVDGAHREAEKAGMSLDAFLRCWCARGSQGLHAEWLRPEERGSRAPPGRLDRQLETAGLMTGQARTKSPATHLETVDVASRILTA